MDLTVITQLAIALILGMIIGLERGWSTRTGPEQQGGGGVRNFGLVGLLGAIAALLAERWGTSILALIFLGLAILVSTAYFLTARHSQDYGTTTELALLMTFVLGALVVRDLAIEAVAVAVVVTWLLRAKKSIQKTLVFLKPDEFLATLQVLLVAAVAFPLLPNQDIGPWQAINPRAIGLIVLLIMTISYGGYFAIQLWSQRAGILLMGVLGGIASSTATTVTFARMAKDQPGQNPWFVTGIVLAIVTMVPRLLLIISLINGDLAQNLLFPLITLAVVLLLMALVIIFRRRRLETTASLALGNPVDLVSAVQYAALLVLLSVLVKGAEAWFGNAGVYSLAAISGLVDVDSVSITLGRSANHSLAMNVASQGILLAVGVNTLMKIVIVQVIAGKAMARSCALVLVGALGVTLLVTMLGGYL